MIRNLIPAICLFYLLLVNSVAYGQDDGIKIAWWLTNPDRSALIARQPGFLVFDSLPGTSNGISVDDAQVFQTMDGFGFCLTGGSATLINLMEPASRAALLKELFATDGTGLAVSYLRLSIGASDLSDQAFSYDDLSDGETDPLMKKFSIAPERIDLIPVLKEIIAINPDIKLLGSPWSAPAWMKTNKKTKGGSLKPEYYDAYARYFVNYIRSMKAEGIRIDAITIQNEPLYGGNNPSMLMQAGEQADFIKNHLGPVFAKAGITTKIILYDHNANRIDYPISILNDTAARKYIDGSAFHLYEGTIEALSEVHNAYPDKNLYFTEQWIGAPGNFADNLDWHIKTLIIGAARNWCRVVLEWNLAADPNQEPHTRGGCTECLGALTINGNYITRNPAYYIVAHASLFVKPGSVRIASNITEDLPNVAFKTPEGKIVLIIINDSKQTQTFPIHYHGKQATASLKAGAVGTFEW